MPLPVAATLIATRVERVQNSGGVLTALLQVTLPPGLLRNIGDCVKISAGLFLAANANSKSDFVIFGATTVSGRTAADNALPRMNQVWVYKRGPNSQGAIGVNHLQGGASLVSLSDPTENDNNSIAIKLSAQGVATGDLESRLLQVEYIPASSNYQF